jgi:TrmH family RNA methyltransferase
MTHPALGARTRIVQSPANRWVKALRAALLRPPALAQSQHPGGNPSLIALEGYHLLAEALRTGLAPAAIFLRGGQESQTLRTLEDALGAHCAKHPAKPARASSPIAVPAEAELLVLPPTLFQNIVETETPQPIAALLAAPLAEPESIVSGPSPLVLVLASIQDPGNVGALLRSAEAFGATGALLLSGTATPWSSKALRASAGSALRVPMRAVGNAEAAATLLRAHAIPSYAAVPADGTAVDQIPLHRPAALWIGNEGAGLGPAELAACDARVTLPMPGRTESLNAAIAGSLLLYEASRQRGPRASNPV